MEKQSGATGCLYFIRNKNYANYLSPIKNTFVFSSIVTAAIQKKALKTTDAEKKHALSSANNRGFATIFPIVRPALVESTYSPGLRGGEIFLVEGRISVN